MDLLSYLVIHLLIDKKTVVLYAQQGCFMKDF